MRLLLYINQHDEGLIAGGRNHRGHHGPEGKNPMDEEAHRRIGAEASRQAAEECAQQDLATRGAA